MGKIKKQKQPVRVVSWEEYQTMVDKLSDMICEDNSKLLLLFGLNPIQIWGIPRGGTIVAVSMSHANEQLFDYLREDPLKDCVCANILVVDDIVDSGDTATPYTKRYPVASLFLREGASFEPDWYVEKIEDNTWIKFPWEKDI